MNQPARINFHAEPVHLHELDIHRAWGSTAQTFWLMLGLGSTAQRTHEEDVVTKALDGVKVALAQTQQGHVGFEDVAVSHPRANREGRINHGIDVHPLEVLADKCQPGVRARGGLRWSGRGRCRKNRQINSESAFTLQLLTRLTRLPSLTPSTALQALTPGLGNTPAKHGKNKRWKKKVLR